jgi:D-aspartate ligase
MACVLGGMDIVSPLGRAGIRCAVAVGSTNPARYSRYVDAVVDRLDPWAEPQAYVDRLVGWAAAQSVPPVLYYPTDADLLMVSRYRDRLQEVFTVLIPDSGLVEDLVQKQRFHELADRVALPVPPSQHVPAGADPPAPGSVGFPAIVKPVVHTTVGPFAGRRAKAVRVESAAALDGLLRQTRRSGTGCIVQSLVPGPESRIESYHAFVDDDGGTVDEFTGKKIRTLPAEYGESTAVTVGRLPDVLEAGRAVLAAVGFRSGVAKVDFKRGPDGRLWLLEVNPRFNLWHNPGAAANVNLPALVHAYLTGHRPRHERPFRTGVTWCDLRGDRRASRAADVTTTTWLRFAAGATTRDLGGWSDPMPLLRGVVWPALRRRLAPGPARGVRA